jgi:integrase
MATSNFFISRYTKESATEAPLYFRIRKKNPKCDLLISTFVTVNVAKWENAHKNIDSLAKYEQSKTGADVIERCEKAYNAATAIVNSGITDIKIIKKAVFNAVNSDDLKEAETAIAEKNRIDQEAERKAIEERERCENGVVNCCDRLVKGIKTGEITFIRKQKVTKYSDASVKRWTAFQKVLNAYYKENPFDWEDIDDTFYLRWTNYLRKSGYMEMTIAKLSASLKHLVIYFRGKDAAQSIHKSFDVDKTLKVAEIFLTKEELQALYDMKLSGLKEQVRDLFLIGCYSVQRFSDYSRITKENLSVSPSGNKVIRFKQKKTGVEAPIPILDDNMIKILEKYDYNVPQISDVVFNRYLKDVCEELSATVPSLAVEVKTALKQSERKDIDGYKLNEDGTIMRPRYECVSSHTARRTAITLMFLSGRYTIRQIMFLSGHKTETQCIEYIKATLGDVVDDIVLASGGKGLF